MSVRWSRLPQPDGDSVDLKWVETGGPSVVAPAAPGFGSIVIERNLKQAVGGNVKLAFLANGVQCDIMLPPDHLVGFIDRWTA